MPRAFGHALRRVMNNSIPSIGRKQRFSLAPTGQPSRSPGHSEATPWIANNEQASNPEGVDLPASEKHRKLLTSHSWFRWRIRWARTHRVFGNTLISRRLILGRHLEKNIPFHSAWVGQTTSPPLLETRRRPGSDHTTFPPSSSPLNLL